MGRKNQILFFSILSVWLLINLTQAIFTEIISDEAYYALYGKNLAWGYFDHPPMVALMTKISSLFFRGNLGVRFVTVMMQPITLLIIWKLIDERSPDKQRILTFFIIASSICLFEAFGFFTTPDAPLLMFTALFLWSYKRYLKEQGWMNILFMTLAMTGLIYSKYHGFLILTLVILSNISLLRSYKIWLAGVLLLFLYSPHILWQVTNNYPSLKFHLVTRSEGFRWHHLLEYIPNQLAALNPFVFGAILYIIIKFRPSDYFERALYFLVAGFTGFFWITAVRGHVEPQWTIACSIPVIILLYNNTIINQSMFRFTRKALLPTILLLFVARLLLVTDISFVRELGFAGKRVQYESIGEVARDLPVVFPGSYQDPALYTFFTGKEAIAVNTLYTRKTEFDYWQLEYKYYNKPAFIYGNVDGKSRMFNYGDTGFSGFSTDSLQTINRVEVELNPAPGTLGAGDSVVFRVVLRNTYPYDINFNHCTFPVNLNMALIRGKKVQLFPVSLDEPVSILHRGEAVTRTLKADVPEVPGGSYLFGVCLRTALGPAINDSFSKIQIMNRR